MLSARPSRQTILVIDDEPAILDLARDLLAGAGYRVVTAATHDEAVIALSAFRFSLILSNTANPAAPALPDHWAELERIRAVSGGAPTVIFSAPDPAMFADYAARGFAGVIAKPFDLDDVLALVRAALSGSVAAA